MDSFDFEEISGVRFSVYRNGKQATGHGFTWHLPVVAILVVAALLGSSAWVIHAIEKGNFMVGRIFAGSFLILFGALYVWGIVSEFRSRRQNVVGLPPGVDAPNSLTVGITLQRSGKVFSRSLGSLGLVEDRLTFRGQKFDFQLRPRDFRGSLNFESLIKGAPVRLLTPKGQESMTLSIFPVVEGRSLKEAARTQRGRLEDLVGQWRRVATTSNSSLFPPIIKPFPTSAKYNLRRMFFGIVLASFAFAILGVMVNVLFGRYLPHLRGFELPLILSTFPWMFPLLVFAERKEHESRLNKIVKLKESGKVEMV